VLIAWLAMLNSFFLDDGIGGDAFLAGDRLRREPRRLTDNLGNGDGRRATIRGHDDAVTDCKRFSIPVIGIFAHVAFAERAGYVLTVRH
jgi:hypothetical protein